MNVRRNFLRRLCAAFRYPVHGDGAYALLAGGVVFTVGDYLSACASIWGILIQIATTGYLAAFAKDIVRTSALGEEMPPGWLDFSGAWADLLAPAIEFLAVMAIAFGPLIYLSFKPPGPTIDGKIFWFAGGLWGCLTFPILFLAVAMMDSIRAIVNPIPLARAVWLTFPDYCQASLFGGLLIGSGTALHGLANTMNRVPVLPRLLGWFVCLYFLMVLMRGFGLLYRHHHDRLQWV